MGALQGSGIRELLGQRGEGGWLELQDEQGEARCPRVSRSVGWASSSLGGSGMRLREGMGHHQQTRRSFCRIRGSRCGNAGSTVSRQLQGTT